MSSEFEQKKRSLSGSLGNGRILNSVGIVSGFGRIFIVPKSVLAFTKTFRDVPETNSAFPNGFSVVPQAFSVIPK